MKVRDIGISYKSLGPVGRLSQLARDLEHFHGLGFRLVEIDTTPFHLIVDGELRRPQLENFLAVLLDCDLRYTVHGLMRLNLAYDPRRDLCQRIMRCQIELCRAMGAAHMVYHSGLQALDAVRHGVRRSMLTDEELAVGARHEVAAFKELARVAADAGVVICMENGDPHQWEHDLIARFGLPRGDLGTHHARLLIPAIVRQLEAIDHPNVGMTLDIAHLHIAAYDLGFDYLDAISDSAPWVRHLHVTDNFGRLDCGFDLEKDRWAFGEADAHLPPGWGSIPYGQVFARLPDYEGNLILEMNEEFWDYFGAGHDAIKEILEGL